MRGTSGVLVFALVVMGFMAFGYNRKEFDGDGKNSARGRQHGATRRDRRQT